MKNLIPYLFVCSAAFFINGCSSSTGTRVEPTSYNKDHLPEPYATKSVKNYSKVIGWPKGKTPVAPAGFLVSKFADGLENPRWIYITTDGDIFVAEANTVLGWLTKFGAKISRKISTQHFGKSKNRITLFRGIDDNGRAQKRFTFAENLNQPLGMLVLNVIFT